MMKFGVVKRNVKQHMKYRKDLKIIYDVERKKYCGV